MSESTFNTKRLITIRQHSPAARVFLRSPLLSDVHSLTERAHDPLNTEFLPWIRNPKTPITIESNTKQVKEWQDDTLKNGGWFLVVCLLPEVRKAVAPYDGEPSEDAWATIGDTGLGPLKLEKSAETGILINSGPILRGKGYAVEALNVVFGLGFDYVKLDKIVLGTHKDNVPMKTLLEKKFGLEAVWNEKRSDWGFTMTAELWAKRQAEKGEAKVVLDIEDLNER